jgi:hypothetical protein
MTSVAEYFAALRLIPDEASFAHGNALLERVKGLATSVTGLFAGALAVGAVARFTRETISALPAITDLSDQTKVSADAIQSLGFAASQSGSDATTLAGGLIKLTRNIGDAAKGTGTVADTFASLGIHVRDAGGSVRDTDAVLLDLADALAKIPDTARRADKATELLGRSGAQLVPFLSQRSAAIAGMQAEARALGLVLDEQTIRAFDDVDDRLNKAEATFGGAARAIVVALLPALERMADVAVDIAKAVTRLPPLLTRFSSHIKALAFVVGVVLVGKLTIATAALVAMTVAQLAAAAAAGAALPGAFFTLVAALDVVIARVSALLLRFAGFAAIGLLLAVAVLAFEDLFVFLSGGDSLVGRLVGRFDDLGAALRNIVTDPDRHPLVRLFAAVGVAVNAVFGFIDDEFREFFDLIDTLSGIVDVVVGLFTAPTDTLRLFFQTALADFSSFVAQAASLAGQVAGAVGADGIAARLQGVSASTVSSGILSASPLARAASSSNSVSVAGSNIEVSVSGVSGDPTETGEKIGEGIGDALLRTLRAAAVDLIPGAG